MSEVEGCTFDAGGPVVAIDLESAGSCDYQSPDVDCKAHATVYGRYVNFLNPPDQIVWTVTGATLISGQGTWTIVVETDSSSDVTFQVQLQCIDSISNDNDIAIRTYTNTHATITDNIFFIGPDIVIPTLGQNEEMEPIDVTPLFDGPVESWALVGTWPEGVSITGGLIEGAPTNFGTFSGLTVTATGNNTAVSNMFSFDVTEEVFVPTVLLNVPLEDVATPVEVTVAWPFVAENDFLLATKFVVPAAGATNLYAVWYKWQNVDHNIGVYITTAGILRVTFKDLLGFFAIDMDVNPTPGSTVEVKVFKSSTRGFMAWFNNVLDAQIDATRTDPLEGVVIYDMDIGHLGGSNHLGTQMFCTTIYSGDMTDSQIESITLCENSTSPPPASLPWMDDFDTTLPPNDPNITTVFPALYPNTIFVEGGMGSMSSLALQKYSVLNSNATNFFALENARLSGHGLLGRGSSPAQTQESGQYDNQACSQGWNIPFTGTTLNGGDPVNSSNYGVKASTAKGDCSRGGVPAKWWLYKAGTTLSAAINSSVTSFNVVDGTVFKIGEYASIRPSLTDWSGIEICEIKNVVGNVVTVIRGYLSDLSSHAVNSYMASIALGDEGRAKYWQYNMSNICPADGNGNKPNTYIPWWLTQINPQSGVTNFQTNIASNAYPDLDFKLIIYDVDRDTVNAAADCNNDGIADAGHSDTGVPYWNNGMDTYYNGIKSSYPGVVQVGGTIYAGGNNGGCNGTQLESMFTGFGSTYSYTQLSAHMCELSFRTHRMRRGPAHNHILFKQGTTAYQVQVQTPEQLMSPFRIALAATVMEDNCSFHQQSLGATDTDFWYDEYAVNLNPAHLTLAYGQSADKGNSSDCLSSVGWLGSPVEDRRRVFNQALFEDTEDMLGGQGVFDTDIAGWTATNTVISHDVDSLHATAMTAYGRDVFNAKIKSPAITSLSNKEYTLCFEIKSSSIRRFRVKFGSHTPISILCDTEYKKYIMVFRPSAATFNIEFQVGRENTEINLRNVYVFEGSADVFVREFDNGIVAMNLSSSDATVNLGASAYQRILGINGLTGPQEPDNDGSFIVGAGVTDVNLVVPKRDAIFLVRQQ